MNKTEQDKKILQYQIWLIGDRCDGWEKQGVEKTLQALIEARTSVKGK